MPDCLPGKHETQNLISTNTQKNKNADSQITLFRRQNAYHQKKNKIETQSHVYTQMQFHTKNKS